LLNCVVEAFEDRVGKSGLIPAGCRHGSESAAKRLPLVGG
jgi:hypothetical protein